MEANTPPSFITLDVDVVSTEDLTPMANYFEEPAFVLGNQKVGDLFHLSVEPCWFSEDEKTPENCIKFFVDLISRFPIELVDLWNRANSKTFDFGFESGNVQPYYKSEITHETLAKIVAIGANFTITIYQTSSDGNEDSEP